MNEELQRVLEEAVVFFNLLDPKCCIEDLRSSTNNDVRKTKFCVNIRTHDLRNTKEIITIVPRKSVNLTF